MSEMTCRSIAHIYNDFSGKFGIPRQSGLASVESVIVFEPEYRNPDALRGLEEYTHLWLLWQFSENGQTTADRSGGWNPTVRPPKLGGNTRMGVFATRSPFRPNPIGLSSVELSGIDWDTPRGAVIRVRGADLMNGTPIFDIKPYLPYTDAHPEAGQGFALTETPLEVSFPEMLLAGIPAEKRDGLISALAQDPRPAYQHDPARVYAMPFGGFTISFTVEGNTLTVCNVTEGE
ncbi:MAG: tRNA (N6-threonylcarbamoyladenosine(37)-N6)-methyltransferase TrmO [Clostridia bacterium]|nr:tRNA (N6-threonylcarbamoyladenosine(37)-N6)-methyltransferase TrmO [Clostridia bacterium]